MKFDRGQTVITGVRVGAALLAASLFLAPLVAFAQALPEDASVQAEAFIEAEGVTIVEPTDDPWGGGAHVTDLDDGDTLTYRFEVSRSNIFNPFLRVAASTAGSVTFLVDGQPVTTVPVQSTGGTDRWFIAVTGPFFLSAGVHEITLVINGGGFNLNFWRLNRMF